MQPLTSAKPRPPARRAPSSRLASSTASPSLARSTSTKPNDAAAAIADVATATDASTDLATLPSSADQAAAAADEPDRREEEQEDERDQAVSRSTSTGRDSFGGTTSTPVASGVPFPASILPDSPTSTPPSTQPHLLDFRSPAFPAEEQSPVAVESDSKENTGRGESQVLDLGDLRSRSKEELEVILQETHRLIQQKQADVTSMSTRAQGLDDGLDELRERHDSLRGGRSSPTRSRESSSPALPTPQSKSSKRRSWRTSLGFAPPPGVVAESSHHRRTSSGLSYLTPSDRANRDGGGERSSPPSPTHLRSTSTSFTSTPNGSPVAFRNRFTSTSSISSLAKPTSQLPFSPSAHDAQLSQLNQSNYALNLKISELEAEAEQADREGRKKLRKLEKELQTLRGDLERVEQKNSALEDDAQLAKERENELARSIRAAPSRPREVTPTTDDTASEEEDTPTWRERMRAELGSDLGLEDSHSPTRLLPSRAADDLFSPDDLDASPFQPQRRAPGCGFSGAAFPFTGRRSISTSSLVPLPDPVSFDLQDQNHDAQVEDLWADIAELVDRNDQLTAERDEVMRHLDEVAEEMEEWKEKCESLEAENAQARMLGWEGPRAAIGWHSDDDADADSDRPSQALVRRRKGARRSSERTSRRSTITPLSHQIGGSTPAKEVDGDPGDGDSPPRGSTSPLDARKRSLGSELDGQWAAAEQDAPQLVFDDDPNLADVSALSFSGQHDSLEDDQELVAPSRTGTLPCPPSASHAQPLQSLRSKASSNISHSSEDDVRAREEERSEQLDEEDPPAYLAKPDNVLDGLGNLSTQPQRRKEKRRKDKKRGGLLDAVRFGSENEDDSPPTSRRELALQRLGLEASARFASNVRSASATRSDDEDSDAASLLSADYDHLDPSGRSTDYYPLTLRARYHPRMVATMWTDSAMRQLWTFVTWVRFLFVLGMAVVFALWQGPKKSIGPRRRQQRRLK
ncbi:hypothetical protein JCM8097_009227 [Rhodosporidiobolus ruineniae]